MTGPRAATRRVTRADVARRAGVSTAVVSYTLNEGSKKVSDATRAKVLAAVAELGYRPNAAARALKLGSTAQLGLVMPAVLNRFFAELTDHVEQEAARHGLALLMVSGRDGTGAALASLAARQVDGVLALGRPDAEDLARLDDAGVTAVLLDLSGPAEGFAAIGADRRGGARLATEHLIGHGHRSIGFVGPGDPGRRQQGWRDALAEAGLPAGPLVESQFSRESGYEAGHALAGMPDRPGAVFVTSDDQAIGVLLALHEAGVRVPEDLAIVSFDGSQEAAYCWPPLTTVAQPVAEMIRLAVERVITPEPGYVQLPTELVVRRSCGC